MGRLRRGGIYGVRDVATALGVEPRELALMIRSGQIPGAAWAKALDAEKKPKKRTEHAALEFSVTSHQRISPQDAWFVGWRQVAHMCRYGRVRPHAPGGW